MIIDACPPVTVHEGIYVVRDDLIPGGTKRRFIDAFVAGEPQEFVYATPAYGGAQIALAIAARNAGKRCTLFVAKRHALHARTLEAQRAGAKVVEVPHGYLSNVQSKARRYCEETGSCLLPHGFDTPEARAAVAAAATAVRKQHGTFAEVWSVAGSGMLTRSLQAADLGREYWAVAVGRENPNVGRAQLLVHSQPFDADAKIRPPFPSCSNYDAKAWSHILARHRVRRSDPGAYPILFWNVMA